MDWFSQKAVRVSRVLCAKSVNIKNGSIYYSIVTPNVCNLQLYNQELTAILFSNEKHSILNCKGTDISEYFVESVPKMMEVRVGIN